MKKLSLSATALYLLLASSALADSNSFIITQASVGGGAPTANFTQFDSGKSASVIQNGNNSITGVQLGASGTKLNVLQENPTNGAANTIGYVGRGNSDVTLNQRASNGIFTASGSAGNVAHIDMAGNDVAGGTTNKLFLDQVGFNNDAIIYDTFAGYAPFPGNHENLQVAQYSDNAAAGNQLQVYSAGMYVGGKIIQNGGNRAVVNVIGGAQNITLSQVNPADTIASGNNATVTINGAGFIFSQNGTTNNIDANLHGTTVNQGLYGWQSGNGNYAQFIQNVSYQDVATGPNIVEQTGVAHTLTATQTNTYNSKITSVQTGTANTAALSQTGTDNRINYAGDGNSQATVYQRANNGVFSAAASANNTANVTMGNNTTSAIGNTLELDQVGYNNTANINDSLNHYITANKHDNLKFAQYSTSAAAGNTLEFTNTANRGTVGFLSVLQKGGNDAKITVLDGSQSDTLQQTNTSNNAALGNTVDLTLSGAGFYWDQNGTQNSLTASLQGSTQNAGLYGWQHGQGNQANVTQQGAYLDGATGYNVLEQTGNFNVANATQVGLTHNSRFEIFQTGNSNNALISQGGTSNYALISQTGNGNQGTISQTGSSNNAQIIQTSNNNVASITQNGNGMTMVIHQ